MHIDRCRVLVLGILCRPRSYTFIPPTFYVPIVVSISITKVLLASFFLLSALGLAWSIGVCNGHLWLLLQAQTMHNISLKCIIGGSIGRKATNSLMNAAYLCRCRVMMMAWIWVYFHIAQCGVQSQSSYCQSHATYNSTLLRLQTPWTPKKTHVTNHSQRMYI